MPEPCPAGAPAPGALIERDCGDFMPPDDNPIDPKVVAQLTEDYARNGGQLVPGLACEHPTEPGKFLILAGVHRWAACKALELMFRAELRPKATPAEVIRLRYAENAKRRRLSPFEISDIITAYRRQMAPGATWAQAGEELGIEPSTLSRLIAPRRIPEASAGTARGWAWSCARWWASWRPTSR